jgi:iron complex outermembrane recepter protein
MNHAIVMGRDAMKKGLGLLLAGSVSLPVFAVPAYAQEAPQSAEGEEAVDDSEIVVTGTLLRGLQPGGTSVISVDQEAVVETGAVTTSQLLQTIPQMGSFNNLDRPLGGGNFVTSNRPNLRNLPGFTTNGSSPTLILIDGHRVVGAGISSTSPDADFVPPGAIARVEIVSDGGSAIYGSDAVAGVINFITRRDINGVEANFRYGFADDYHSIDGNFSVGKTWDRGGIYLTYNYSFNDQILGIDRDFVQTFPANTGLAIPITSLECPGGNVNVRGSVNVYGLPYTTATAASRLNVTNQCDLSDYASLYPEQKRHTVFAGLRQELSDNLEFNLRVFYLNKQSYQSLGLFHETRLLAPVSIPGVPGSPFLSSFFINPGFELQNVAYGYGTADSQNQRVKMTAWGVIPEFKLDLGGSFQARLLGNYGESITDQHSPILRTDAIVAALPSGLFNPYAPLTSDPATLAAVSNYETFGHSEQSQTDFRLVIDGDLFQIGEKATKIAFGAEYLRETFRTQRGQTIPGAADLGFVAQTISGTVGGAARSFVNPARAPIPRFKLGRTVKALFGELAVPIGDLVTLSASGRYDHYSDFGGTFNPRFGATFKPTEWLTLRGAWGKNFAAPSLADDALADPPTLNYFSGGTFSFLVPSAVLVANGYPAPTAANSNGLITLGAKPGLQPQRAKTWSLGFDIEPQLGSGALKFSASYYNLNYKGLIGLLPFTSANVYFSQFQSNFIVNPTQAQIDAAVAGATIINGNNCAPSPACVYIVEDARKQNLGGYKVSGLDISANMKFDTGFGSIDYTAFANYEFKRDQAASVTSPFVNLLADNNSRFRIRNTLGLTAGGFRAQATWSHNQGYSLNPVVPAVGTTPAQTRVSSYNVFDLFFKYDVGGDGIGKDLSFTLNVNNVFDKDPPVFRAQQVTLGTNGYANGNTLGRYIQFGVAKKF